MHIERLDDPFQIPDLEHELKFMQNETSIRIEFPDHIKNELEMGGIIIPIKELLYWFADGYPPEESIEAQKMREIADRCYDPPEEENERENVLDTPHLLEEIEAAIESFWPEECSSASGVAGEAKRSPR